MEVDATSPAGFPGDWGAEGRYHHVATASEPFQVRLPPEKEVHFRVITRVVPSGIPVVLLLCVLINNAARSRPLRFTASGPPHRGTPAEGAFDSAAADPLERCLSHYFHACRLGFETLPLDAALALEQEPCGPKRC